MHVLVGLYEPGGQFCVGIWANKNLNSCWGNFIH